MQCSNGIVADHLVSASKNGLTGNLLGVRSVRFWLDLAIA
jgi:hypothetical protein